MLTQACIVISLWLERDSRRRFRALDAQVLARGGRGGVPDTCSLPPTPSESHPPLQLGNEEWAVGGGEDPYFLHTSTTRCLGFPPARWRPFHLLYRGALKINEMFLNTLKAPGTVIVLSIRRCTWLALLAHTKIEGGKFKRRVGALKTHPRAVSQLAWVLDRSLDATGWEQGDDDV